MKVTEMAFGSEAKQSLMAGVDKVANAVKSTLGPGGRHVAIQKGKGKAPHVTKDGVTVADNIGALPNPYEDIGAQLVKQAAQRTAAVAGDGTTTSTVLAQAMIKHGFEALSKGNVNVVQLKREMDEATVMVVDAIKHTAKQITLNSNELAYIATISANNDPELGNIIAHAMRIAGEDGVVTVEGSSTDDTSVVESIGLEVDKGFISDRFINDPEMSRVEFFNPVILLYPKKISDHRTLLRIADECVKAKRSLLIISDNVDSDALGMMVRNVAQLPCCAIKLPHYGSQSLEMLEDIAVVVGGTVISEDAGHELSKTTIAMCGTAERVVITKDKTILTKGAGTPENVNKRITQLKNYLGSDSIKPQEVGIITKRIAKIQGKSSIIYIGAPTDVERREKADRVDDALRATKAAIEEGIVAGSGNTLAYISKRMFMMMDKPGHAVIQDALTAPMYTIMGNAGIPEDNIHSKIHNVNYGLGINLSPTNTSNETISLIESGVIDPAKVVRVALENANSVAGMVLTTECLMVESEELLLPKK